MSHEVTQEWVQYYLRDHFAGATAGVNLFGRVSRGHSDPQVRTEVARIRDQIKEERRALKAILVALNVRRVSFTMLAGIIGERAGRLKPNGAFLKRSAGADVLELEILSGALQIKGRMWETLLALAEIDRRLDAEQMRSMRDQATEQRDTLISLHARVIRNARGR